MNSVKELEAMLADAKNKFSVDRTKMENNYSIIAGKVKTAMKFIPDLDERFNTGSLADFIPELYKENGDKDTYISQLQQFNQLVQRINQQIISYNKAAISKVVGEENVPDDMSVLKKNIAEINEAFLSNRAKQELKFQEWVSGISALPKELIAPYEISSGMTLKDVMPSYYEEDSTYEQRVAEYQKLSKMLSDINAIEEKYNEEASRCLSEYRQFHSVR